MPDHRVGRILRVLAIAIPFLSMSARGELAAWDQAQVTALSKELVQATNDLYETFRKQPEPSIGSTHPQAYYRLKQFVRILRSESQQLAGSLERGEAREQTLAIYDNLMQLTRSAREDAGKVFVAHDVGDRASVVRGVLNRLGPYYDPDFQTLSPHPNIEPSPSR
jgi:hypothetical protein